MRLLLALLLALFVAAPAQAATDLLSDDAEGAIDAKWVVGKPDNPAIEPWQRSDTTTTVKHRGNMAHGGATSYWAGVQPQNNNPSDVVQGSSTLTTKASILVPADGATTISLWSFFQNEGDDLGLVEVAVDNGGSLSWKKLTEYKLAPSAAGDTGVPGYCNPSDPAGTATQTWEEVTGDFKAYAGKKVFVRLNLKYGGENRTATQECGWYVDDIKISTTGTPGNAGVAAPATSPAMTTAPPATAAKPSVKVGALKAKGKKASLKLTVGGGLSKVTVTLLKGSKKVATVKAASLAAGARAVSFKLKKKLKKGAYTVKITGVGSDGSAFSGGGKAKAK
jgi:methionine-rich copper-binding protein CopC